MSSFKVFTHETAPEGSKKQLETINGKLGFVPNIFGVMAASPATLAAYSAFNGAFEASGFTAEEREVVALAVGTENECGFCTAAHSAIGRGKVKMEGDTIYSLRAGKNPSNKKLAALAQFARALVQKRGSVGNEDVEAFKSAGYTEAQALEVTIGVAHNIFTNYVNNMAHTPLNEQFKAEEWSAGSKKQAA